MPSPFPEMDPYLEDPAVSPGGQTLHVFDARGRQSFVSTWHVASITFDPPPPDPDVLVG